MKNVAKNHLSKKLPDQTAATHLKDKTYMKNKNGKFQRKVQHKKTNEKHTFLYKIQCDFTKNEKERHGIKNSHKCMFTRGKK